MNPQEIQTQVIKHLKKTRTHFTKIIKMVETKTPSEKILDELNTLRKEIYQASDLIKLPNIAQKINEGKLHDAIKDMNPFS